MSFVYQISFLGWPPPSIVFVHTYQCCCCFLKVAPSNEELEEEIQVFGRKAEYTDSITEMTTMMKIIRGMETLLNRCDLYWTQVVE